MARLVIMVLKPFFKFLDFLTPFVDLVARLWVAKVFFYAGLVKLDNWAATISLFETEYKVPFLTPTLAAYLGTFAELALPILLVLGLGGRVVIFGFFIYNLLAMWSFTELWTAEGALAMEQHINWGLLLGLLMCHGSGKISIDYWLRNKYRDYLGHPK
jgi:putative oxidoreductase